VPENAHQLHVRATGALRTPPVEDWATWPFEGPVRSRPLAPPGPEPRRDGEGGVDCSTCAKPDGDYLWADDRWRLRALEPTGLPIVLVLEPRAHHDGPADLPDELAQEQGIMLGRVERAVLSIGEIGRVHIGRWGEGGAHLHWWFIARPAAYRNWRAAWPRSGTRCYRRRRRRSGARTSRSSRRRCAGAERERRR
jgi:hypothetical protein